ncbi:PVC-type heme-binding CxxCH protein [Roseiconus nitratireducens]|nr:PVC-type heme-binding CxxCH protein [Roseiconus nitratireducens]
MPRFSRLILRLPLTLILFAPSVLITAAEPASRTSKPSLSPAMTPMRGTDSDFEYVDVGKQIPNYTPSDEWGVQGEPLNLMQKPLAPEVSMKHFVVPEGFHVELFVSEPQLKGKPICMAWDERGRLWVAETYDYPNELQPENRGRDKIRICEDTDGDGRADKFTVFAEALSIPTSMAFTADGVLVQNGNETLLLTDTDGDDVADQRQVVVTGWELGDTHGGVSNFQYGLDNWIWAMQGYNNSAPKTRNGPQGRFRMGFLRMRTDAAEVEFIRSTNNNTWGLGISEEGLIFGSTANGNPSIYMPIPNRYYERVRGWTPSLTLSSIADTNEFHPITDKVRQVDHHGGYTAAAGHALYTARAYPEAYWNRVSFVAGPTGHLVGAFVLESEGTDFHSSSPFNLIASDDEWSAPIMAEVGPDGNVWVMDWYNYIVQHNPTPQGFETGKGSAYETELRDKKHGRVYRIVPDQADPVSVPNLAEASAGERVDALSHPTMLVRKHAQRLLVKAGDPGVADRLIQLIENQKTDAIGLNVGAIHALWTLHGLELLDGKNPQATAAAIGALRHPSAGVRRNAAQVLPADDASISALLSAVNDSEPQVRLATLLALSDHCRAAQAEGAADDAGRVLQQVLSDENNLSDRWIPDAITSAAASVAPQFLTQVGRLQLSRQDEMRTRQLKILSIVADHLARGEAVGEAPEILASLQTADPAALGAVVTGLYRGWDGQAKTQLSESVESKLEALYPRIATANRSEFIRLAERWGSDKLAQFGDQIVEDLTDKIEDEDLSAGERLEAAKQLVEFRNENIEVVESLLDLVTPQAAPELSTGLVRAVSQSSSEEAGKAIIEALQSMTPKVKSAGIRALLSRQASTTAVLDAIEDGKLSLNDLALDQREALANHPNRQIRQRAGKILEQGGAIPSADRQEVLDRYVAATNQSGDPTRGKALFTEHCSKCHVHSGLGVAVGPDLTGMAVHPKEELLVHILDPSRSVEGNFRAYNVLTIDGDVINGMLGSESKTAIEIVDTTGKKQTVLRDDIEQLSASRNSIMPSGFEKSISIEQMTDLLEFLTSGGKFVSLDLRSVATTPSDRGMFINRDSPAERLDLQDWSPKTVAGVPFRLIDPADGTVKNVIVLHSPNGPVSRTMPRKVQLEVGARAKAIHFLSGVAGWGYPYGDAAAPALTVRLHYADGGSEDHELLDGVHFADYIRRVDVPKSQFAFAAGDAQVRYFAVSPQRSDAIDSMELIDGSDAIAPVVLAITIESPTADH